MNTMSTEAKFTPSQTNFMLCLNAQYLSKTVLNYLFTLAALALSFAPLSALAVNSAPVVTSAPVLEVNVDSQYSYRPDASDDESTELTWSVKSGLTLPSWLLLEQSSGTSSAPATPSLLDIGERTIDRSVMASDGTLYFLAQPNFKAVHTLKGETLNIDWLHVSSLVDVSEREWIRDIELHDDTLYISTADGNINRGRLFSIDLTQQTPTAVEVTTSEPLDQVFGFTISNGYVYYSDSAPPNGTRLRRFELATGIVDQTPLMTGLYEANAIVSNGGEYIHVNDGNVVKRWSENGGEEVVVTANNTSLVMNMVLINEFLYIVDASPFSFPSEILAVNTTTFETSVPVSFPVMDPDNVVLVSSVFNDNGAMGHMTFTAVGMDLASRVHLAALPSGPLLTGTPISEHAGDHAVCLTVSDGINQTDDCFTIHVNSKPSVTGSDALVADTETTLDFAGLTIVDGSSTLTLTIQASQDTVNQLSTFGFVASGAATVDEVVTGQFTITGSVADIMSTLAASTVAPVSGFTGSLLFDITLTDTGGLVADTTQLQYTINDVNQTPEVIVHQWQTAAPAYEYPSELDLLVKDASSAKHYRLETSSEGSLTLKYLADSQWQGIELMDSGASNSHSLVVDGERVFVGVILSSSNDVKEVNYIRYNLTTDEKSIQPVSYQTTSDYSLRVKVSGRDGNNFLALNSDNGSELFFVDDSGITPISLQDSAQNSVSFDIASAGMGFNPFGEFDASLFNANISDGAVLAYGSDDSDNPLTLYHLAFSNDLSTPVATEITLPATYNSANGMQLIQHTDGNLYIGFQSLTDTATPNYTVLKIAQADPNSASLVANKVLETAGMLQHFAIDDNNDIHFTSVDFLYYSFGNVWFYQYDNSEENWSRWTPGWSSARLDNTASGNFSADYPVSIDNAGIKGMSMVEGNESNQYHTIFTLLDTVTTDQLSYQIPEDTIQNLNGFSPFAALELKDAEQDSVTVTVTTTNSGVNGWADLSAAGTASLLVDPAIVTISGGLDDAQATLNQLLPTLVEHYEGEIDFVVTVDDGTSSVTQNVTLDITPVNDLPNLNSPEISIQRGDDSFTLATENMSISDIESDTSTLVYSVTELPTNAHLELDGVVLNVNDTFSQTDIDSGKLKIVKTSGTTVASSGFKFSVEDPEGGISQGTLPIDIVLNTPPTMTGVDTLAVDEDGVINFAGVSIEDDLEQVTLVIKVAEDSATSVAQFDITELADNSATVTGSNDEWTISGDKADVLAVLQAAQVTLETNYNGSVSFDISLIDDEQLSSTLTSLSYQVNAVDDAAIFAGTQSITVYEDDAQANYVAVASSSTDGFVTVSDIDSNVEFNVLTGQAGQYGSLTIMGDGSWEYWLDPARAETIGDETVQDIFTLTLKDSDTSIERPETVNFTVNIVGENDAPTFTSEADVVVSVGDEYRYSPVADDVDSSTVTFSGSLPSWLTMTSESSGEPAGTIAEITGISGDVVAADVDGNIYTYTNGEQFIQKMSPDNSLDSTWVAYANAEARDNILRLRVIGDYLYIINTERDKIRRVDLNQVTPLVEDFVEAFEATDIAVIDDVVYVSGGVPSSTIQTAALATGQLDTSPFLDNLMGVLSVVSAEGNLYYSSMNALYGFSPVTGPTLLHQFSEQAVISHLESVGEHIYVTMELGGGLYKLYEVDTTSSPFVATVIENTNPLSLTSSSNGLIYTDSGDLYSLSLASPQSQTIVGIPALADAGNHEFCIDASDGGLSERQCVTVLVNAPPEMSSSLSVNEDNILDFGDLTLTDTTSDSVTVTMVPDSDTLSAINNFMFTAANDAVVDDTVADSVSITGSVADVLATIKTSTTTTQQDYNGDLVFDISLTDNYGLASDTAKITYTVVAINDSPVPSIVSTASLDEDGQANVAWDATDPDGDVVTISVKQQGEYGTATTDDSEISYVPNANFNGTDTVTVALDDNMGGTTDHEIVFTINPVNDIPTISGNFMVVTDEDKTAMSQGTLIINDVDANQSTFIAQSDTVGQYGSFSVDANGQWSYQLDNANGDVQGLLDASTVLTESFTVESADGSANQQVFVTITGKNDTAVISGTVIGALTEDLQLTATGTLSVTDSDSNQAVFAVTTDGTGSYGSYTITDQGVWSYALNSRNSVIQGLANGATITDSFIVTSIDGSASETITLTITGTNDSPAISGVSQDTVNEDSTELAVGSLTISDPDSNESVFVSQVNTNGLYGAFTLTTDGNWTYTLDNTNTSVQALAEGIMLTDIFTATAFDTTESQEVTVTIVGVNDIPVISGVSTQSLTEDTVAVVTGALSITDFDSGGALFTEQNQVSGNYGVFSLTATGDWTYTLDPTLASVQALASAASLSDSFTVVSTDGSASQTVTMTITGANDSASISGVVVGNATEDSDAVTTGSLLVVDVDTAEAVFIPQIDTLGQYGSFTISESGDWSFSLDSGNASVQSLPQGITLTDSFDVVSFDNTAIQTVVITIAGINDLAVISGANTATIDEDSTDPLSGQLTISDQDTGENEFQAQTETQGLFGQFSITIAGVWQYVLDTVNEAVLALTSNQTLDDSFDVVSQDSSATETVTVTIQGTNDAAEFDGVFTGNVYEDGIDTVRNNIVIADIDGDNLFNQEQLIGQYGTLTLDVTGQWSYTADQTNTDVQLLAQGQSLTDTFALTAADGTTTEVTVTVNGDNDKPIAIDDVYALTRSNNDRYLLDVLANDSDTDDAELTVTGVESSIGTTLIIDNQIQFEASTQFGGQVQFSYTIADNEGLVSRANVVLAIDNPLSEGPTIVVPDDVAVNATGLYTRVDLGIAEATDSLGRTIAVGLVDNKVLFAPGRHLVYWQATDEAGNTTIAEQVVTVNPMVSLSKDRDVAEGTEQVIEVVLNGDAVAYPYTVNYTVTGSADQTDHTLTAGSVTLEEGTRVSIPFNILDDVNVEADETIVVTLEEGINLGANFSTEYTILEGNLAPEVELQSTQAEERRTQIVINGGDMTITLQASDQNIDDTLSVAWNIPSFLTVVEQSEQQLVISAADLVVGLNDISVTVTDNGTPALSTTETIYFDAIEAAPVLSADVDSDGDLIPDNLEGAGDSDNDGIPDYQDAINECNVLPASVDEQTLFLAEGEPGVCLRKGPVATIATSGGLEITDSDGKLTVIDNDEEYTTVSGLFDYIAYGLPTEGQAYHIVFAQLQPIPNDAVYRKYSDAKGWTDFVIDADNQVYSAKGEAGVCPPPRADVWTEGLSAGDWCVQLMITDGGPNDTDGEANGSVADPGGVSVLRTDNTLPNAVDDALESPWNRTVTVDVLANDTDADGDSLTLTSATADYGSVVINADNTLSYEMQPFYAGVVTITYGVTDASGGTSYADLSLNIVGNEAPVAVDDSASINDRQVLNLDVLANDTDEDGDALFVSSASAVNGSVVVNVDNTLTYTPYPGVEGVDVVTYVVNDGYDTAVAEVSITINAWESPVVKNTQSGGSLSLYGMLTLLMMVMVRFTQLQGAHRLVLATMVLATPTAYSAEPEELLFSAVSISVGYSKTSLDTSQLPADAELIAIDESDTGFAILLDYPLTTDWYGQIGYVDLGNASATLQGDTLRTEVDFQQSVESYVPELASGFVFGAKYAVYQNNNVNYYVSAGALIYRNDNQSVSDKATFGSNISDFTGYVGAIIEHPLTEKTSLQLGFTEYFLEQSARRWSVGIEYKF